MTLTLRYLAFALACLLVASLLPACGEAPQEDTGSLLLGKWTIDRAYRNGKPTETLDDLYFEFYDDGQMRTNLSGKVERSVFELEAGTIRQRDGALDANYTIEEVGDSTLVLSTSLRNFNFRFYLSRSAAAY